MYGKVLESKFAESLKCRFIVSACGLFGRAVASKIATLAIYFDSRVPTIFSLGNSLKPGSISFGWSLVGLILLAGANAQVGSSVVHGVSIFVVNLGAMIVLANNLVQHYLPNAFLYSIASSGNECLAMGSPFSSPIVLRDNRGIAFINQGHQILSQRNVSYGRPNNSDKWANLAGDFMNIVSFHKADYNTVYGLEAMSG